MNIKQLIDSGIAKPVSIVYEMSDYSLFTFREDNRDIDQNHVNRIVDSITESGRHNVPILCNNSVEVIDGQHRFTALKSLSLPIQFVVEENAGKDACIALNSCSRNWKNDDFIFSHAKTNPDYTFVVEMFQQHPNISHMLITHVCFSNGISAGHDGLPFTKTLRNGEMKLCASREEILVRLGFIEKFQPLFKNVIKRSVTYYLSALLFAWRVENVDENELFKKISSVKFPEETFTSIGNVKEAVKVLDKVIDKGRRNKVYLEHKYKVFCEKHGHKKPRA